MSSPPRTLPYVTLDVFTKTPYEGNPLAIVHILSDTPPLSQQTKQTLAREYNYSETVFLYLPSPSDPLPDIPEYKVNIFTTDAELPLAGHPIIGTATHIFTSLLSTNPKSTIRLLTKAGPVTIDYNANTESVRAGLPHNVHLHSRNPLSAKALGGWQPSLAKGGLDVESVMRDARTLSIVKGMTFVYVPLPDLDALGSLTPGGTGLGHAVRELDEGWDEGLLGVMFYVVLPSDGGAGGEGEVVRLRTRMIIGSLEDPATGSASSGLGALLSLDAGLERARTCRYRLTQAVEMGRRSEIGVDVVVDDGKIKDIVLEGSAVEVMSGKIRY